ncbi:MAG: SPFH/Band 7/PHB domain protein [Acidobacteria bacterium]|nr:SPFH/Band 7/PHB domain protein [Acidobacteriota bacterium]
MQNLGIALTTFFLLFVIAPIVGALLSAFGLFTVVQERQAVVYTFSGRVIGVLNTPGAHCPFLELGPLALLVSFMGRRNDVDLRLDQEYLRSQPVNSEEGAPMGIGVWYEMYISDPVAFLFKNTDPRGSLRANVSNATVRCLSNLKLNNMLENRHDMSRTVRAEVSPHSHEWGYLLGSIYIRKVHFRDHGMIRQIEEKVVNRLRQVTAAIRQDGANQVSLITSTAEREASVEFARAAAIRPQVVGGALQEISERDAEVSNALFDVLETQRIMQSEAGLLLIPSNGRHDSMVSYVTAGALAAAGPAPGKTLPSG